MRIMGKQLRDEPAEIREQVGEVRCGWARTIAKAEQVLLPKCGTYTRKPRNAHSTQNIRDDAESRKRRNESAATLYLEILCSTRNVAGSQWRVPEFQQIKDSGTAPVNRPIQSCRKVPNPQSLSCARAGST